MPVQWRIAWHMYFLYYFIFCLFRFFSSFCIPQAFNTNTHSLAKNCLVLLSSISFLLILSKCYLHLHMYSNVSMLFYFSLTFNLVITLVVVDTSFCEWGCKCQWQCNQNIQHFNFNWYLAAVILFSLTSNCQFFLIIKIDS